MQWWTGARAHGWTGDGRTGGRGTGAGMRGERADQCGVGDGPYVRTTPRHTRGVQRNNANRLPTPPHASAMFMVRYRVRGDPPPRPTSSVLQSRLPPARLRASSRIRARTNRPAATGSSPRRDLDGYRLRTQPDGARRRAQQGARPANIGPSRGPSPRKLVWLARTGSCRTTLQRSTSIRVQDVRRRCGLEPLAIRDRRVERARTNEGHARRNEGALYRPGRRPAVDRGQRSARRLTVPEPHG